MRRPTLFFTTLLAIAPACAGPRHRTEGAPRAPRSSLFLPSASAAPLPPHATEPRTFAPALTACEDSDTAVLEPAHSTLVATVEPVLPKLDPGGDNPDPVAPDAQRDYHARGLDAYRTGPGWPRVRRTTLLATPPARRGHRRSLAWFVHLSDLQLADDESPNRVAGFDAPSVSGAVRPQEPYLPRALSAMDNTLGGISRAAHRPFDFGVITGDVADSAQRNELRWATGVLDGARGVHTDSGRDDDPLPGPGNDPKDPFDAVAFPAPWYYVPGNHDLEIQGVFPVGAMGRAAATGTEALNGTRDWTLPGGAVRRGEVVPDPEREPLDRAGVLQVLRESPAVPGPVGHGYPPDANVTRGAHYVADVVPGLLRMIVLDTVDDTGGASGMVRRATLEGFVEPELERARRDGVLVVIASHHPTTSIDRHAGELGDDVADAVSPGEIERAVAAVPNVILWLEGHEHNLRVRPVRGPGAGAPGYWAVQSGSFADWPNQARVLELVDNGDGTLSVFGTLVDYEARTCLERRFRALSLMDERARWTHEHTGNSLDRNVELVLPVPPGTAAHVAAARGAARVESEAGLR